MVLAGDIITFKDFSPLKRFLRDWKKPVIYVAGNHEHYTLQNMQQEATRFLTWLAEELPHVHFLQDESITIDGVHFFGGTMWTDFSGGNPQAMMTAKHGINDFRLIVNEHGTLLSPEDTVRMHASFVEKIAAWFEVDTIGARMVVTHHAPVINPNTKYRESPLAPAFNSLDMVAVIEKYQPDLWIYGHTHECDDQRIGRTRIISNQSGYPNRDGTLECTDFDPKGLLVTL